MQRQRPPPTTHLIRPAKIKKADDVKVQRYTSPVHVREPHAEVNVFRPSLLSSDGPKGSYRGFVNLALLVLTLSNIRLVFLNLAKYGVLVRFSIVSLNDFLQWPVVLSCSATLFCCYVVFLCELFLAAAPRAAWVQTGMWVVQWFHVVACLLATLIVVYTRSHEAVSSAVMLILAMIAQFKMLSYMWVNAEHRGSSRLSPEPKSIKFRARSPVAPRASPVSIGLPSPVPEPPEHRHLQQPQAQHHQDKDRDSDRDDAPAVRMPPPLTAVCYPANVTWRDFSVFLLMPTLCYELHFARSPCIRWSWLGRRVLELVVLSMVQCIVLEQWIKPTILNTMDPLEKLDVLAVLERGLKLAIPNMCFWLLGFYMVFHVLMNIFGELTFFSDRRFYHDWWNSTDLEQFWRTWNIPVHNWLLRHVLHPCKQANMSRWTSAAFVFLVSAVYHEILVSGIFRTVKCWAFLGMIAQIPFILFSRQYLSGTNAGNVFFWLTILLGQPFCVLMYYQDYYLHSPNDVTFMEILRQIQSLSPAISL
eukprot:gnl/Spiro4/17271_TR9193_c0_g1_i1.p1 gnl/Spiro4/17271_TR9193_c0_g1~~gnl/Spiro4/17271_TR9193_c0_g1_i1.p1  ORF type:complete len:557 (+),score=157.65 gnl/Spiro4/17271_TR9193_c0_g1_i1:80-1672(+)